MTPLIKADWYALEIDDAEVVRAKEGQLVYCLFRVLDGPFHGHVFPNAYGVRPGGRTLLAQFFRALGVRNHLPHILGDLRSSLRGKRICARVELRVEPHLIYPCITEMYPYDSTLQHSCNLCG